MTNQAALAALEAKAGTYEGQWRLFGQDAAGHRRQIFAWTDVATTSSPTVEASRAYLHVTDVIAYEGGGGSTQQWTEGVLLESDGRVGKSFVDMNGVVTIQEEPEPGHFVYRQDLAPMDLSTVEGVTADNLIAGHHTMDKRVTIEDGVETHTITRTTHVEWTSAEGPRTVDFESLTGVHRRRVE